MDDWAAVRFPELFRPRFEEYANADLEFRLGTPPDELVSRVHVIALDRSERVVVCRSVEGWRFLPGGTRESGEPVAELVRRELLEEAGASLLSEPEPAFAYSLARSHNPAPYRPHFTHPVSAWAYAVAHVELTGDPGNPADGETVVEVRTLPAAEAAAWVRVHDREHGDVILLAEALGLLSA